MKKPKFKFSHDEVLMHFTDLKKAIGTKEFSFKWSDFRLMHVDNLGSVGFKHVFTGNYIFLTKDKELIIPAINKPFLEGIF